MTDSIDADLILDALGREVDWRLPTGDDLIAAAGEPVDRAALHRRQRFQNVTETYVADLCVAEHELTDAWALEMAYQV